MCATQDNRCQDAFTNNLGYVLTDQVCNGLSDAVLAMLGAGSAAVVLMSCNRGARESVLRALEPLGSALRQRKILRSKALSLAALAAAAVCKQPDPTDGETDSKNANDCQGTSPTKHEIPLLRAAHPMLVRPPPGAGFLRRSPAQPELRMFSKKAQPPQ